MQQYGKYFMPVCQLGLGSPQEGVIYLLVSETIWRATINKNSWNIFAVFKLKFFGYYGNWNSHMQF